VISKFIVAAFISFTAVIGIGLYGCQTTYSVKVIGEPSRPTFVFEEPVLVGYGGFAYVSKIPTETGREERIWLIECERKEYSNILELSYGKVPEGFIEKVKPMNLDEGYYSFVISDGSVTAHTNFRIKRFGSSLRIVEEPKR
jgi:hypothetical protein